MNPPLFDQASTEERKNEIVLFFHCSRCMNERPPGQSPADYSRIEAGWTKRGVQVRCQRHDMTIIDLNFEEGDFRSFN